MPNFAVIESNVIINTIVAEDLETAQIVTGKNCIEITGTDYGIDDIWDGTKLIKKEIPNAEV